MSNVYTLHCLILITVVFLFTDVFTHGIWKSFSSVKDKRLQRLVKHIPDTVLKSRQHNTVRQYSYGFQRWKKWSSGYAEVTSLPAEPQFIVLYLLSL